MSDASSVHIPRFRNSFTRRVRRLGLATSLIAALVVFATIFLVLRHQSTVRREDEFRMQARFLAHFAPPAILARHDGLIAPLLESLMDNPAVLGLAFYDAKGELVISRARETANFPVRLEASSDRSLSVDRSGGRVLIGVPVSLVQESMEERAMGKKEGVSTESRFVGRLLLVGNPVPSASEVQFLLLVSALAGGGVFLAGLLMAIGGARRVLRPFWRILRGVESFRNGDLSARIQLDSNDELGHIADSFNRLARDLSARMEELRQWKDHLEREVAEKTREIQDTSAFLHELIAPVEGQGGLSWNRLLERLCRDSRAVSGALHAITAQGEFRGIAAWPAEDAKLAARRFDGDVMEEPAGENLVMRRYNLRNPDGLGAQLVLMGPPEMPKHYLEQVIPALTITLANARAFVSVRELAARLERQNELLQRQKRELETQKAELELANRLKSQFVANVSHELRTPLNAIIGYSGMLAEGLYGPVNDSQAESIRAIEESGRNLLNLINTILDHSRLEADRMPVYPEKIEDLRKVIRETVSRNQPLTRERPYEIEAILPPMPVACISDPGKIQQIVTNLISNAVKFTEQGFVKVALEPRGEFIEIAVQDTGCGIPEQEQENIFQEFRQVDGTSTRAAGGTGLGLSVSRRLAHLLQGTLTVQSRVKEGSTFTLRIPRHLHVPDENASPGNGNA